MRLAVISDIHGNYKAFEAFLDYLKKNPVDRIIGLGDYVTDSPYPQYTMELLSEMQKRYDCILLRGNREAYLLENAASDQGWRPGSSANGALWYTAQNLTGRDLEFFASLPEELRLKDGTPFYLCHGTPGFPRGNVTLGNPTREEALAASPERYLLGGHSHHQELFHMEGKTYLNPGSLGIAVDGVGGVATFATMTSVSENEWETELHAIPYDLEGFLSDFEKSGLEELGGVLTGSLKKTLRTGHNFFFACVQLAEKLGGKQLGKIPESVWEEVARELL